MFLDSTAIAVRRKYSESPVGFMSLGIPMSAAAAVVAAVITHQPKLGELDVDEFVQILGVANTKLRAQGVRQPLLLALELRVLPRAP